MDREPKGITQGKGQKIVVGMSGGVDSSIALILLRKNGWDPVGVSLKYCVWQDKSNKQKENICCSTESIITAKKICKQYDCKHITLDISKQFEEKVINYFVDTLKKSQTPNPCMICNRETKFKELISYADSQGIKYVSTGHYAKITKNKKYNSYFISLPKDKKKDQTYYLSLLPQEYLERIIFPLGDLTKEEVYKIAEKEDLDFYLKLAQSQDFCFVSEGAMSNFLEKEVGGKKGTIVDTKGKIIGTHLGLQHYTIGQRKGIGLSGGPYFVVLKDIKKNTLVVSKKLIDLQSREVKLANIYLSSSKLYKKKLEVEIKIRYQAKASKATLNYKKDKSYNLVFKLPQTSITPGQFAVFYIGHFCIGSGVIM
jgi:tRNA-specific 2-thiouridylase